MTATRIVTAPTVHPVLEVAVGDVEVEVGQARYDQAHYDVYPEATYAGLDPLWTEVSCDTIEASTYVGRERSTESFDIGTATVTAYNTDGTFDYPSSGATVLSVRPGRQVRVGVVDDALGGPWWLWRGWIDASVPLYDPVAPDAVTLSAVDAKGEYGRATVGRVAAGVGAGETVDTRLNRIANAVAVPAHRRQFDPSGVALRATELGARAWDLYDSAATSAGGVMFGDENGFLTYRGRDWQAFPPDKVPDAAIGNRPGVDDVCPNSWEVSFERADFANRVLYGRQGEDPRMVDDPVNRDLYGVETFELTNLETDADAELTNLANRVLRARNFGLAPRIAAVTLDAHRPGVIDLLVHASAFTPSLYTCTHVDPGDGRTVFARLMYVTGVEHTITATAWTARLALDDATPYITTITRYDEAHYDVDRYTVLV